MRADVAGSVMIIQFLNLYIARYTCGLTEKIISIKRNAG